LENIKNRLAKPSMESKPWAIWIWNSYITPEKLVQQLNGFIEKGFGGICIKPGRDMLPGFLSKEFFDLLQKALTIAQQANIGIRISEDFSLPWTGIFESITNQDEKMRGRVLKLEYTEFITGKKSYEKIITDPENAIILMGKVVNGKIVLSQTKKIVVSPDKGIFSSKSISGDWQFMVFRKNDICDPVAGYIPNVLNTKMAQWYIDNVCEIFKKNISKYFHTTFKGFIYELPSYIIPGKKEIPWDDELAVKYQAKFKKKLIDQLPALFFNVENEHIENRPIIYSFINQFIHEQFTAVLEKWCAKNRITQWVLCPEQNSYKSASVLKYYPTIPEQGNFGSIGIQNEDGSENNVLLRAVSDANALLYRRETITVIGRNRQGASASLQQLKSEVDRSILTGPSTICLDGCFFNIDRRGYIKTPHNPSWYSPDWIFMKSLCEYIARAVEISRNIHLVRNVAILNPINSILAEYSFDTPDQAQKTMSFMQAAVHELECIGMDFDIVNEEMLESCSVFTSGEFAPANKIRKGNYRAIIIPQTRIISSGTLAFLEKIAQKNGLIVFIEEAPQGTIEDGNSPSVTSRIKKLFQSKKNNVKVLAYTALESLTALIPSNPAVSATGKKCPDIFSSHSVMDGMDMFCLHNTSEFQDYFASVEFLEQKNIYVVDCTKGEFFELQETQKKENKSRINLTFLPKQTYFVLASPTKLQTTTLPKGKKPLMNSLGGLQRNYCIMLKEQWQFNPASPNILPLANWNTRIGLSRESGGYSLFYEAYFEVRDIPDNCVLALAGAINNMNGGFSEKPLEVAINGTKASEVVASVNSATPEPVAGEPNTVSADTMQTMQNIFGACTFVYDIKNHIRKGINRISLRTLGVLFDPLAIVYPPLLAGSFSIIKGATGWILSNSYPTVSHDSWTKYGYPYLSGTGIYKQVFELPGEYNRLILRFSKVSDSIDVAINGKPLGILNWHPMEIDITDVCETRRNELTVKVVNTIDNILRMNGRASGLLGEVYVDVY